MKVAALRLILVVALIGAATPFLFDLEHAGGNDAWIARNADAWHQQERVYAATGAAPAYTIAIFADDVLAPDAIRWQQDLTDFCRQDPSVRRVVALGTVPDLVWGDGPEVVDLLPAEAVMVADSWGPGWRSWLREHPLWSHRLIATDGSAAAIHLAVDPALDAEAVAGLGQRIEERLSNHPPPDGVEAGLGGLAAHKSAINRQVASDQRVMVPVAVAALAIGCVLLLGHWATVGVPLLAMAGTAVWLHAAMAMTGTRIDAVMGLLPPLVLAITTATALHLVHVQAGCAMARGEPQSHRTAWRRIGLPVLLTAATTIAGLAGLWFGPVEAVRRFAIWAVTGNLMALIWCALALWALAPAIGPSAGRQWCRSPLRRFMGRSVMAVGRWCASHRLTTLTTVLLAAAASTYGVSRLSVDSHTLEALGSDHALSRIHQRLDRLLGASMPLELAIALPRQVTAADITALAEVDRAMAGRPTIAPALGLHAMLALVERVANDAGATPPDAARMITELRQADPETWRMLVPPAPQGEYLLLTTAQTDGPVAAMAADAEFALAAAQQAFPGARVSVGSGALVLDATNRAIVPAVAWGLAAALPAVGLLMLLALRNWRLAVGALPVAGLPLLVTYGLMAPLGWDLDVGTSMIACIALGLVVDDTIHLSAALHHHHSLERALAAVGPVLAATSLVLMVAFTACLTGDFVHTRRFGILLALAFACALVVTVSVLPTLVRQKHGGVRQ